MNAAVEITTFHHATGHTRWRPAIGERAWHTEEGRRRRVTVIAAPFWSARDGCDIALCAFVDEQMARFEVPVSELGPADATWDRVPALVALRHTRAFLGGRTTDAPLAQHAVAAPVSDNDEPVLSSVRVNRNRLTPALRASLDLAERLGGSSRRADQKQARELVRDVFLALARGAERSDRDLRTAELRVLEEARGSGVEFMPSGALRVSGRDGLDTLLRALAITATEHAAGMRYRVMFENAGHDARIRSVMADSVGRRRVAMTEAEIFAEENWRGEVAKAKSHRPVEDVERYVRAQVFAATKCAKAADRAITALRAIAGMGWTLYRLAPSGRRNKQYGDAIRSALTAAADYFGMW